MSTTDPDKPGNLEIRERQTNGDLLLSNSSTLTVREIEILRKMVLGLTNREIAAELFLAVHTIEYYATRIYQKLGVKNRTQAAMLARHLQLGDSEAPPVSEAPSRDSQAASVMPPVLISVKTRTSRRYPMKLIIAGVASTALTIAGLAAFFPSSIPLVGANPRPQHCVGQPDYVIHPDGTTERLSKEPLRCFDSFEEAIQSLGLDPAEYHP
jgi:DNA-binding CsgD family transcriptional regulator